MMITRYTLILLFFLLCSFSFITNKNEFVLVGAEETASVYLDENAGNALKLAVNDLLSDVKKITGRELRLTSDLNELGDNAVIIGDLSNEQQKQLMYSINPELASLTGKWEAYSVNLSGAYGKAERTLLISGSNELGTIFGIYHFLEEYLHVDPFYYWTGIEPKKKTSLVFSDIEIVKEEPDFKYRGWFINDEDLLTEFINGAGNRNIDYKYYGQVVDPDVINHVFEALVRSRYNLVIPASFLDIMNPPERRLVEEAVKRGLYVSQHHIEPVGVSAFTFFNYFKNQGLEPPLFSFYSSRDKLEEVWEAYVAEWAKFPNVIWQIGLRGIGDRPMWMADPNTPQSDQERGALISEAMQVQKELILKYDQREKPPITTTLWAEGAGLTSEGYLSFPSGTTIVFADNSPGYVWQDDFYEIEKKPELNYGIYYHHQLWASGPHLIQATPPGKTYEMLKEAVDHRANEYMIMNVSNIREFVLGIAASSSMMEDIQEFKPHQFLMEWAKLKFGAVGNEVAQAYTLFFDSYQIHPETQTPYTLDGQMKEFGRRQLADIQKLINDPKAYWEIQKAKKESSKLASWGSKYLGDMHPERGMPASEYLSVILKQAEGLENCLQLIPKIDARLEGDELQFFEANYKAQVLILYGINQWLEHCIRAKLAAEGGDHDKCSNELEAALKAYEMMRKGKGLASLGKWEHWYRGDRKMNINEMKERTEQVWQLAKKNGQFEQ